MQLRTSKGLENYTKEHCVISRGGLPPSSYSGGLLDLDPASVITGGSARSHRKEVCEAAKGSEGKDMERLEECHIPPRFHTATVEGALSERRYE
jgi:hypothetical protein